MKHVTLKAAGFKAWEKKVTACSPKSTVGVLYFCILSWIQLFQGEEALLFNTFWDADYADKNIVKMYWTMILNVPCVPVLSQNYSYDYIFK